MSIHRSDEHSLNQSIKTIHFKIHDARKFILAGEELELLLGVPLSWYEVEPLRSP